MERAFLNSLKDSGFPRSIPHKHSDRIHQFAERVAHRTRPSARCASISSSIIECPKPKHYQISSYLCTEYERYLDVGSISGAGVLSWAISKPFSSNG
jgi:hypothetical protein